MSIKSEKGNSKKIRERERESLYIWLKKSPSLDICFYLYDGNFDQFSPVTGSVTYLWSLMSVCRLVGLSVGWSVIIFQRGREVTLPHALLSEYFFSFIIIRFRNICQGSWYERFRMQWRLHDREDLYPANCN